MNQLAVISEVGLREAEFYRGFIELCLGVGWLPLAGRVFSGRMGEGLNVYGVFPVCQVICPAGKQHDVVACVRKAKGLTHMFRGRPRMNPKSVLLP